jgi:preprotein translocase SecE subunit
MKMTAEPQATPPAASAPQGTDGKGVYKPAQGRHARMAAYWAVVLLVLFGCSFLHGVLVSNFESTRGTLNVPGVGDSIPILGVKLTPAFLIAAAVFFSGMFVIYRWQQKPKVADLLIDTEGELRKVTWPSLSEIVNSSIVVGISVILIGLYLAFSDWFLNRIMRYLLFGEVGG